jgi:hypothetical protein
MDKVVEAGREAYGEDAFEASDSESEEDEEMRGRRKKTRKTRKKKRNNSTSSSSNESEDSDNAPSSDSEMENSSDDERRKRRGMKKKPSGEVRTKKVALKEEVKNKRGDLDEVTELAWKLHGMDIADINYTACFVKLTMISTLDKCIRTYL